MVLQRVLKQAEPSSFTYVFRPTHPICWYICSSLAQIITQNFREKYERTLTRKIQSFLTLHQVVRKVNTGILR